MSTVPTRASMTNIRRLLSIISSDSICHHTRAVLALVTSVKTIAKAGDRLEIVLGLFTEHFLFHARWETRTSSAKLIEMVLSKDFELCNEFFKMLSHYKDMHKTGIDVSSESNEECDWRIEFLELKEINIDNLLQSSNPLVAMPLDSMKYLYQTSFSEYLDLNKDKISEKDIQTFKRKHILKTQLELKRRICLEVDDKEEISEGLVSKSLKYLESKSESKSSKDNDSVIDSKDIEMTHDAQDEASSTDKVASQGSRGEVITCSSALVALRKFLIDEYWFKRHGAAVGFIALLSAFRQHPPSSMGRFLEDVATRSLCVIALDRFADYSGSEVMAPVRESAAQVLALVAGGYQNETVCQAVMKHLTSLCSGGADSVLNGSMFNGSMRWELKHGIYLASAYLIALLSEASSSKGGGSQGSSEVDGAPQVQFSLFATQMSAMGMLGLENEMQVVREAAVKLLIATVKLLREKDYQGLVMDVLVKMKKILTSSDVDHGTDLLESDDLFSVEHVSLLATLFNHSCLIDTQLDDQSMDLMLRALSCFRVGLHKTISFVNITSFKTFSFDVEPSADEMKSRVRALEATKGIILSSTSSGNISLLVQVAIESCWSLLMCRCATKDAIESISSLISVCLNQLCSKSTNNSIMDSENDGDVAVSGLEGGEETEKGVMTFSSYNAFQKLFKTMLEMITGISQIPTSVSATTARISKRKRKATSEVHVVKYPKIVSECVPFRARVITNHVMASAFISCIREHDDSTSSATSSTTSSELMNDCCAILCSFITDTMRPLSDTMSVISAVELEACLLFSSQWLGTMNSDCKEWDEGKSMILDTCRQLKPFSATSLKECSYLQQQLDATSKGLLASMVIAGFSPPNTFSETHCLLRALDETAAAAGYSAHVIEGKKDTSKELAVWLSAIKNSDANLNPVYKWHEKVRYTEQHLRFEQNSWLCRMEVAHVSVLLQSPPPQKLGIVIRPLISSLKVESEIYRRQFSANLLSEVALLLRSSEDLECESRWLDKADESAKLKYNSALDKVLSNLCNFIGASDSDQAPHRHAGAHLALTTLCHQSVHVDQSKSSSNVICVYGFMNNATQKEVKRESSCSSLSSCFKVHPILRLRCFEPLSKIPTEIGQSGFDMESVTCALHLVMTLVPHLSTSDLEQLYSIAPGVANLAVRCGESLIRELASSCLATVFSQSERDFGVYEHECARVLETSLAMDCMRKSVVAVLLKLTEKMGVSIVRCLPWLFPMCISALNDFDSDVRLIAAKVFNSIVQVAPLCSTSDIEKHLKPSSTMSVLHHLILGSDLPCQFTQENLNRCLQPHVTLRPYQKEGISWILFLFKSNLHGALCDEMGVGKTIQVLTALSLFWMQEAVTDLSEVPSTDLFGEMFDQVEAEELSQRPKKRAKNQIGETIYKESSAISRRCLIVCPTTLIGHWSSEASSFLNISPSTQAKDECMKLSVIELKGSSQDIKTILKESMDDSVNKIFIASYNTLRSHIETLSLLLFDVIVLDEGHIITNRNSKVSKCARLLRGKHRLLLSGTPIQNRASDLWALFDFLMPGYLGTHAHFKAKFSVQASSNSTLDPDEVIAMELLHRNVLPFILRREKRDVLGELPPKIIIDVPCELTEEQNKVMSKVIDGGGGVAMLRQMALTCVHPALAVVEEEEDVRERWLKSIQVSGKLTAMVDILRQTGLKAKDDVTNDEENEEEIVNIESVSQKFIIFAQNKATIDLIQRLVFDSCFPTAKVLRIDSSVAPTSRVSIAKRFNDDLSVHGVIVSTKVGGLGLSLSSAEIVIFAEHDWNPMVDLQAQDRAHRIGQLKSLCIYRLYSEDTIEEKMLNIQKRKTCIAETVVNNENKSLTSLSTDRVMDLIGSNLPKGLSSSSEISSDQQIEDQYLDLDIQNFIERFR